MANETENKEPNKPGADASAGSPKRPTTIDLKATDITPEPVKDETVADDAAPEAATIPEPAGESVRQETAPPAKGSRRSGIGAAIAAAIVFFVVGIGAGHWLSGQKLQWPAAAPAPVAVSPSPELVARIARLETQVAAPAKDDSQLQARLAKIEAQLAVPRAEDPQLQARLARLEAQVGAPRASDAELIARVAAAEAAAKTLADMAAAREKRNDDVAAIANEAHERASRAVTAAEAAKQSHEPSPEARADVTALASKLASLEQTARSSQADLVRRMGADDAKGRFAVAAIALRDVVDSGTPYQPELAAAKALSGDAKAFTPLEPFATTGLPGTASLGRELTALMPSIWKAARKDEPQQGSFLERLQANASRIIRVRPAGEAVGDDPASVSARLELRAEHADINGALAELAKLPADARAPADAWIKRAEARNAAIAAARAISQNALGALAKTGS